MNEPHGVMVPYKTTLYLSPGFFRNELEIGLNICAVGEHLAYSDLMSFTVLVLNPISELLAAYAEAEPEGAKYAAKEMIRILRKYDSDDEKFPEREIDFIRKTAGMK